MLTNPRDAMLDINRVSRVALRLLQCNYTELSPRHYLNRTTPYRSNVWREAKGGFSKIANFSHLHVFCASAEGVLLGIEYRRKWSKTWVMGLPDGPKNWWYLYSFSIQNRRATDRQTRFDGKDRPLQSVARVKVSTIVLSCRVDSSEVSSTWCVDQQQTDMKLILRTWVKMLAG